MLADRGKPLQVEANMYDSVVIKGLSINRKVNGREEDYSIFNDIKETGYISYLPKYLSNPSNFQDKDVGQEFHDRGHLVIFRAFVQFRSGFKLYL